MCVAICRRVEDSFLAWESALSVVPCVYVTWVISSVQVMLNSVCCLISFCGVVESCGEIVMCVEYVVSCEPQNRNNLNIR
jgi:hypothetical protein